jgi:hypothetical protein
LREALTYLIQAAADSNTWMNRMRQAIPTTRLAAGVFCSQGTRQMR